MFSKILIANRGEIAVRVIKTAREYGIQTVAVYSEADKDALHVALADEAVYIGSAAAHESYLRMETLIEVARKTGAEAIHPGYGFLSENAEFAEKLSQTSIKFIGPSAAAIRAMGSKSAAKTLMAAANVPLVPGYHGDNQDPIFLKQQADEIGYPLLIKASAGGGGKGMRLVMESQNFIADLESCQREARASFGDDKVLIEKYVTNPRHIEMQIFADSHGNVVHLFERDCSIQRRHQKVVEEAPAPGLTAEMRHAMGQAAVNAAKAISYEGAGTIEFIVECDDNSTPQYFYFMEMNTRLQVEHPVTEFISGQDLVAWQLQVAAGGKLPVSQEELKISGHAIEVRLYAEDPENNFLPATGKLDWLDLPSHIARIDSGVQTGDHISIHYDPMIAKVITHGADRKMAITKMRQALQMSKIVGVKTNRDYLANIVKHDAFIRASLNTAFIESYAQDLIVKTDQEEKLAAHFVMLAALLNAQKDQILKKTAGNDVFSPWQQTTHWRLNDIAHTDKIFKSEKNEYHLSAMPDGDGYCISCVSMDNPDLQERCWILGAWLDAVTLRIQTKAFQKNVTIVPLQKEGQKQFGYSVVLENSSHNFYHYDPATSIGEDTDSSDKIISPMPGKITSIYVSAGEAVKEGALLMILEAMKMEHRITAPRDAVIMEIGVQVEDQVADGDVLISFTDNEEN